MGERRRVLWLIKGLGPGGAERMLVESARHVDRDRFEIEAAYVLPWKDQLAPELEAAGVRLHPLRGGQGDPRWVLRLRALMRDGRFHIVHAHSPVPAVAARLAARTLRRRPAFVTTEHNLRRRYHPLTRWAGAATARWDDATIAVSEAVAAPLRSSGIVVEVIPNGVDGGSLRRNALSREEARRELGLEEGDLVVGSVGGITAKKGYKGLVTAAARVTSAVPEARFVLIGLPVDAEPVRQAVRRMGIEQAVLLAGYRPGAARLMTAFDVFCLASAHEGMPVSLLEAMSLGVTPVVTAVGGVPEVVHDGVSGLVVPAGDVGALAGAIERALTDDALRVALGGAARKRADSFDIEACVRRTESVYVRVARRES